MDLFYGLWTEDDLGLLEMVPNPLCVAHSGFGTISTGPLRPLVLVSDEILDGVSHFGFDSWLVLGLGLVKKTKCLRGHYFFKYKISCRSNIEVSIKEPNQEGEDLILVVLYQCV